MKFDKYIPSPGLAPYIKQLVISENPEEQTYRILPDTSLVLGFQYKGKLSRIQNDKDQSLSTIGITGLQDAFSTFKNSAGIGTVLVYFTETGAVNFFKNPLNELFNESVSLDSLVRKSLLDDIEEQLAEAETDKKRIKLVEKFLLSRLHYTEEDRLVVQAIHYIKQHKGALKISALAKLLHTSQSPLEKRFRKIVGATPKKFSSITRIRALLTDPTVAKNLTEKGYNAGYFDQSHFIKEFKQFTGETPEDYFKPKE